MKITSWRIIKSHRAEQFSIINGIDLPTAFDGVGASLYPGRWNSKPTPMVYSAGSQSLATLEILVHLEDSTLLDSYSIFPVEFDDKFLLPVATLHGAKSILSKDWQTNPPNVDTRLLGDKWIKEKTSLVLAVPSAVIPNEFNYLINPYHPDMGEMSIGEAQVFPFDARLKY